MTYLDEPVAHVQPSNIRDVTLRDGLQLTGKLLDVDTKIRIVRALLAAGFESIEIGAMARPDRVPPMANTLDVIAALDPADLARSWVWAATPRSIARAIDAGARNFEYCLSVSDAHNLANVGRTTEESVRAMPEAIESVLSAGGQIQLTLSTSFTCPFEGAIDPDRVVAIANDARTEGAQDLVICDTLGQADPSAVSSLITRVRAQTPERRVVFHGHDTWGLGVANSLAAIAAGAAVVDGALGGLGGCPFAPGASGNTATEDLLFAMKPEWLTADGFRDLVELSGDLLAGLDEPNRSRSAHGARSTSRGFPWAVGAGTDSP